MKVKRQYFSKAEEWDVYIQYLQKICRRKHCLIKSRYENNKPFGLSLFSPSPSPPG
jgi:hypothetical protein